MERGVFLTSTNLDSSLMVNCLQVLLSAHPSIKFTSVNFDEKLHGYRIYFSEPSETTVLERKYLTTTNQPFWIYPITAFLTIRDVSRNANDAYRTDLKEAIGERFGKLLKVVSTEKSFLTENWRVLLDIPEFKGLDVFHRERFPEMSISLPQWNAKLRVAFWCRCCKKHGHFQHECESYSGTSAENQRTTNGNMTNSKKNEIQPKESIQADSESKSPAKNLEKRLGEYSKFSLVSTDTYAEMIGREEIMKAGISSEENQQINTKESTSNAMNTLLTDKDIKKEVREDEVHSERKEEQSVENIKRGKSEEEDSRSMKVPKEEPGTTFNEDNGSYFDKSDDDEIQFVEYLNRSNPINISSHISNFAAKDEVATSEDVSRSPTNFRNEDYSNSSFSVTPGPSNRSLSSIKSPTGVEITSSLSERLQDCINQACDTCNVLDRKTLDAFLIHVKKKSNPIRVALNFTKNAKGLKEQLQMILHMYYNTPQTGTKEDIQFIKWLNGLVERFDGTVPRKRKRAGQSSDERPNKK